MPRRGPGPGRDRARRRSRGAAIGPAPPGRHLDLAEPPPPQQDEEVQSFNGVKVFSTTLARDREVMGETISRWLRENPRVEVVDRAVALSSDREFHCLSIVLFYREELAP